jgi:hypothetical protein
MAAKYILNLFFYFKLLEPPAGRPMLRGQMLDGRPGRLLAAAGSPGRARASDRHFQLEVQVPGGNLKTRTHSESNLKDRTTQTALDPLAGSRLVPGKARTQASTFKA